MPSEHARPAGVRGDLHRLGVDGPFARALLPRLAGLRSSVSPESYAAVLAGVSLAYAAHRDQTGKVDAGARDLGEVQSLMHSFVGELQKIDEALQSLVVYLQRLRSHTDRDPDSPLH